MQDSHDGVSIQISGCSDVVTLQVPRLELWFGKNSHPSHSAVATVYKRVLPKLELSHEHRVAVKAKKINAILEALKKEGEK